MKFVAIKPPEQSDLLSLHARSALTGISNYAGVTHPLARWVAASYLSLRRDVLDPDLHCLGERAPFAIGDLEAAHDGGRAFSRRAVMRRAAEVEIPARKMVRREHRRGVVLL